MNKIRCTTMNYQIQNIEHIKNECYVQKLAFDFELLDAWEFPICFKLSENDSLYKFRKVAIEPTFKNAFNNSITGLLFKFRALIGQVFKIDKNVNKLPIPDSLEFNLTDRMTDSERLNHLPKFDIDIRTDNYLDFKTVYSFENETLNEISNASEHALMHYSWIKNKDDCYRIQMASYVKHRSKFGPIYIKLIEPFKRKIVYPYLFDEFFRRWKEFKSQDNT